MCQGMGWDAELRYRQALEVWSLWGESQGIYLEVEQAY